MVISYIYLTCWHMKSLFYERQQLCMLSVEDEWMESAHDRALSINGGRMWF
jgi:hypothetical protein